MSLYCECGRENNTSAQACTNCGRPLLNPTLNCNLKPGAILNKRYIIKKVIKDIGTDALYEAIDEAVGNSLCLIKEIFISDSSTEKESPAELFMKESKTLQACKHKNLPAVRDYFTEQDRYYLVMDYIDGSDLETLIVKYIPENVPETKVIEWTKQMIDLMEYLYENCPYMYKDLNPGNIMVDKHHEELKLLDAGISKTGKAEKSNISNDIYSLGVIMYCLLTGKFSMDLKPVAVKDINSHVSDELNRIIMKSLSKKEGRYRSFRDLHDDLTHVPGKKERETSKISVSPLIPKKRYIPHYPYRRKNGKNLFNKVKTLCAVIACLCVVIGVKYFTDWHNRVSVPPVAEKTPVRISINQTETKMPDNSVNGKADSEVKKEEQKAEKNNISSLKSLSASYFEGGDYNKAISMNKQIIAASSSDISSHISIGTSYYKLHEYKMAEKWFKKALSLKPFEADRHLIVSTMAAIYMTEGQKNISKQKYDEGALCFKKVLHIDGNNSQAKEGLATCFLHKGIACLEENNYMKARTWFNQVVSLNIKGQILQDAENYISSIERDLGYASNNYYQSDYYTRPCYNVYHYEPQDYQEKNSSSVNSELHYDNIPAGGTQGKSNNSEGNSELHYE
ncbi:MAG: protein kinase [Candidatus Eremiobacterota bacterium]